jgi:hypothetical protein
MTIKIANKDGFRWGEKAYLIGHELGLMCVAYANNEQDALDYAVDAGYLDCQLMSDSDHAEYDSNGWHDSFLYAGSASEPLWSEYLWIKPASERKEVA